MGMERARASAIFGVCTAAVLKQNANSVRILLTSLTKTALERFSSPRVSRSRSTIEVGNLGEVHIPACTYYSVRKHRSAVVSNDAGSDMRNFE